MSDLVSIIVPVYNRGGMLQEAVASAIGQTYRPLEVIIVDDESTDDTPIVINSLEQKHSEVRSIRRPNGGPGLARESGRQAASGELIQYLDSDDLLMPRKVELQVRALQEHPECGVAYGMTRYRDRDGREIECTWKDANQSQRTMFPSFLVARWWETSTPLYRRSVTDAAGPWTDLRLEEDWEYDCRVAALGVQLVRVSEVVAEHRDHERGRLSRGRGDDPERLRYRARAHLLIAEHARRGGVDPATPEFQHYARELFHLARQCGAAGLPKESQTLIAMAREISRRPDVRFYEVVAKTVGWARAGRAATWIDRFR